MEEKNPLLSGVEAPVIEPLASDGVGDGNFVRIISSISFICSPEGGSWLPIASKW